MKRHRWVLTGYTAGTLFSKAFWMCRRCKLKINTIGKAPDKHPPRRGYTYVDAKGESQIKVKDDCDLRMVTAVMES